MIEVYFSQNVMDLRFDWKCKYVFSLLLLILELLLRLLTYVSCLKSSTSPSKLPSVGPLMVIIGWRRNILGDSLWWWWYGSREENLGGSWLGLRPPGWPWRDRWWCNWPRSLLGVFLKFWTRLSWICTDDYIYYCFRGNVKKKQYI